MACLGLAAVLAVPALAQEAEVSMRLDVVAWGDEIGGLSFTAGAKSSRIKALPFQYSEPVSYSGPALMEIYKNGDGDVKPRPKPSEEDLLHELKPLEPEPEQSSPEAPVKQGLALELEKRRAKKPNLVALAQLPSGCRRATVLLAPSPGGTFLAYVIDDDPSKLPLGRMRVHNLSPHTIALRNGKDAREIKTRGSLVIAPVNQALSYDLAYQADGEWKFQEHNIIPVRENEQTQMIVLRSGNSFFRSADGSTGGYLQCVVLRRGADSKTP